MSIWGYRNECEREGADDHDRYGRPSYERSRYDHDDACYFRGYDDAERAADRREEERREEAAAEQRAVERRAEARREEQYQQEADEEAQRQAFYESEPT